MREICISIDSMDDVFITYKDSGPGIPVDIRPLIFKSKITTKDVNVSGVRTQNVAQFIADCSAHIEVLDSKVGAKFLMQFFNSPIP